MAFGGLRNRARRNAIASMSRPAARAFHQVWYETRLWTDVTWQGVRVEKNPMDLWMYQEIIHETEPDLIIETGTHSGGSALFFAHLFDIRGAGQVVTVDVDAQPGCPDHPRITYIDGSSTDPQVVADLQRRAAAAERVMLVLDSDHRQAHVREELQLLSPLVTGGCYLVVEDTNINGHPVHPRFGPGPAEALREFLSSTQEFVPDGRRERFLLTFNPNGWLRRL